MKSNRPYNTRRAQTVEKINTVKAKYYFCAENTQETFGNVRSHRSTTIVVHVRNKVNTGPLGIALNA